MSPGYSTPLLEQFRRGEVDRELRLDAASASLPIPGLDQLVLLMLLATDPDPEVCARAIATLAAMPTEVVGDVVMPTKVSRPGCEETDTCYIPTTITVETEGDVTWVNEDSAFHSVTSGSYDAPTELFDSGYMDPYESYTVTFDQAGTFDYFCTLHPWMKGQVVVG